MAKRAEKEKAIKLRKQGYSYSQIKEELGISKGTLSAWLRDMPLSISRINELRARSPRRIERFRNTMAQKKSSRRMKIYERVSRDLKKSKNSDFIAGFYLYWGEGTKTAEYTVSLANSDPALIVCFIKWLQLLGIDQNKLKVKLHIYADQKESTIRMFWSRVTGVSEKNFNKSYVKRSHLYRKTYKGMFSYGTCVVIYHDRDTYEYVMAGVAYLQHKHRLPLVSE